MFITLEGPEGGGKTTHMPMLAEFLRDMGYTVFTTREPGGTAIGDQVRAILMNMENTSIHPRTETLLFCAARAQIVEEVIRPRLERGEVVISDRYADSTLAYQGYGHQNDVERLRQLLDYATGGLQPDLTVLFDLDVDMGLSRKRREGEWNRMDDQTCAFHQRVREGYLELAARSPQRFRIVDAAQPFETVHLAVRQAVVDFLQAKSVQSPNQKANEE